MKIIIVGAGRLGYFIAGELSNEKHDITVIDRDKKRMVDISNNLDVITMPGNGVSCELLKEADAAHTDLLIAVTNSDETNILACIAARKAGIKRTVARVRNSEYFELAMLLKEEIGLSMLINPEEMTASEISRILRFPAASKVEPFANGKAESVEFRISAGSPLDGLKLSSFHSKMTDKVLVCAVSRNGSVSIPRGDFTLMAGDRLNIIGGYRDINSFLKKNKASGRNVKTVLVCGGGTIAFYLAKQLSNTGIKLKIIEKNERVCAKLKTAFPKTEMVFADGTKPDVLSEEGLADSDAFVAVMGDDEDNAITSLFASSVGVSKVITKIKESGIIKMLSDANLDSVLQPASIATQNIVRFVRSIQNAYDSSVETLYYMFEGKVETLEFRVSDGFEGFDIPIKELRVSKDALIAAIIRNGSCIVPGGDDVIVRGDKVIVTTVKPGVRRLDDVVEVRL
ncbi:MAG: Trk system potassium transporter TrkA [Clostridia bacterium]|nr:Trk system potassium transporter TrkA [Clostridia bacterium]